MPIFMMFGKYTKNALKNVSAQRTKKAIKIIRKMAEGDRHVRVMGEHDLVFTLDFPTG